MLHGQCKGRGRRGRCGRCGWSDMVKWVPGSRGWTRRSGRHAQPWTPATVDSTLPHGVSPPSLTCPRDSRALSRLQKVFQPGAPAIVLGWSFACSALACACAFLHVLAAVFPCIAMLVLGCQELFFALLCFLLLHLLWALPLPSSCSHCLVPLFSSRANLPHFNSQF